ncbi:hypothetical protein UJ39_17100 [Salmonella enterica subsp. enterica serovar Tennessee]|nr:hypothetical protein [Salmonella enterica subsp. enterica serovar Tennessee]EEI4529354.1 hypothetical protein [Salmonella enterica]
MSDVNFAKAIQVVKDNVSSLLPDATDFTLEEALLSDDELRYEITFSFMTPGTYTDSKYGLGSNPLMNHLLAKKDYRTFLVDRDTYQFRGFRMIKK